MAPEVLSIGVDVGGTKIEAACVDQSGRVLVRVRRPTLPKGGSRAVIAEIAQAVRDVMAKASSSPAAIGIGIAGQVEVNTGIVQFSPNLDWHKVPIQSDLTSVLGRPVFVANDVRVAAWGEWIHGSGKDCKDLLCIFVGTGIGGGVVSSGRMLWGASGTLGEIGHMTVELKGPLCHCGNQGCLESIAGGWGIAKRARDVVSIRDDCDSLLTKVDGGADALTAKDVVQAARAGDALAKIIVGEATEALIAGTVNAVNLFNPARIILGGGIIEGMPELIMQIEVGVKKRALKAAIEELSFLPASLHNDSGVIGAAAMALRSLNDPGTQIRTSAR